MNYIRNVTITVWYNPNYTGIPEVGALKREPSRGELLNASAQFIFRRDDVGIHVLSFDHKVTQENALNWAKDYMSKPRRWLQEN